MKVKTYKNGNFTVKSMGECAPYELAKFAMWLCNNLPEDMQAGVETGDEYTISITAKTGGKVRYYSVNEDTMNGFRNWKTVRLISEGFAPNFVLPDFYKDEDITWELDGAHVKGVLFTFCGHVPDATRKAMEDAGCIMLVSRPMYAPETRHEAAFVPRGVCFSYC